MTTSIISILNVNLLDEVELNNEDIEFYLNDINQDLINEWYHESTI